MLDIEFIRQNPDLVKESIKRRRLNLDLDLFLKLDNQRRKLLQEIEDLRKIRNDLSDKVPGLKTDEKQKTISKVKNIKEKLLNLEADLEKIKAEHNQQLLDIPNLLSSQVPKGKDDSENKVIRKWGSPTAFDFKPKDHVELGESLDLIDFDKASKVSGGKFYFLKNSAVLLQIALEQYALDLLIKEGFTPVFSPVLAKNEILSGAGFNPRGPEKQIYTLSEDELSLIATAEITLNGYYANEVIPEEKLPIKFVGISECYRREAGSWGRFSKGLYRVHHFTKVEMFIFCKPDQSEAMHEYLVSLEEKIYQGLKIPYQIVDICDGDLGSVAYRKYDLEAWMPGRDSGAYGEVTSCSNCTDYQARRINIKYKDQTNKKNYAHTLNGTAIAISRTLIAILENYQQKDGSVEIPEILQKYMAGMKKITLPS